MDKALRNNLIKLGEGTLLLEAIQELLGDFPIERTDTYIKWNSGILECFGTANYMADGNSYRITLPKSYKDRYSFDAWASFNWSQSDNINYTIDRPAADTFRIRLVKGNTGEVLTEPQIIAWKTYGRWK